MKRDLIITYGGSLHQNIFLENYLNLPILKPNHRTPPSVLSSPYYSVVPHKHWGFKDNAVLGITPKRHWYLLREWSTTYFLTNFVVFDEVIFDEVIFSPFCVVAFLRYKMIFCVHRAERLSFYLKFWFLTWFFKIWKLSQ